MATIKICDACKKQSSIMVASVARGKSTTTYMEPFVTVVTQDDVALFGKSPTSNQYDFCIECYTRISNFVRSIAGKEVKNNA